MPDFVFIQSKELPGGGELILYTKPVDNTYPIFRAYKFDNAESYENFVRKYNLSNASVKIDGYRILICYTGILGEISDSVPTGQNISRSVVYLFNTLTTFYKEERIHGNESRLKKFIH